MAEENQVAGRIKVLMCSSCFREITLGFSGECNAITRVRERGRGDGKRVVVRGKWEIWKDSTERRSVRVFYSQGMGVASGSGKRQGPGFSPGASGKEHGPTNTVRPAQRDLGETSDPQDCERTNSCEVTKLVVMCCSNDRQYSGELIFGYLYFGNTFLVYFDNLHFGGTLLNLL